MLICRIRAASSRHAFWQLHFLEPLAAGAALRRPDRRAVRLRVAVLVELVHLVEDCGNAETDIMLLVLGLIDVS